MHIKLSRAHCNVAARNCLVGEDDTVKIFNLGNSMTFSNSTEMKLLPLKSTLPLKWTAPEVIEIPELQYDNNLRKVLL